MRWETHILMPKLSTACYALRTLKYRRICWQWFIMPTFIHLWIYGVIFWGNSSYSNKDFKLQKRIVRIPTGTMSRDSGHDLLKNLNILTLPSQYIFSLLRFVIISHNQYMFNERYIEEILDNYKFSSTNIKFITVSKMDS